MSNKNYRTIYTNSDDNFYGEFPARPVRRAFGQKAITNKHKKRKSICLLK